MKYKISNSFLLYFNFKNNYGSNAFYSIGIGRIALFCSFLWVNQVIEKALNGGDLSSYLLNHQGMKFHSFSLLMLFNASSLSSEFWQSIMLISKISTILSIVGFLTPVAMITSVLTNLLLALLEMAWQPSWCHPYNVVFLAGIAFMFGNGGASFSIDKWLSSSFSWYPFYRKPENSNLWWPVLLTQFAIALFYFAAFYSKMYWSGFNDFVFTDNLRNALAVTWLDSKEYLVPSYIKLVWNHPILWKLCAFFHLITQFLPILACFSIKRPGLRLLEGLVFVGGVVLLYVFMTVWNPWWILLGVFFIDWDYYIGKLTYRRSEAFIASHTKIKEAVISSWICIFLSFYCFVFLFQKGEILKCYPFCNMHMYSSSLISSNKEHLNYFYEKGSIGAIVLTSNKIQSHRWVDISDIEESLQNQCRPKISQRMTVDQPLYFRRENDIITFIDMHDHYWLNSWYNNNTHYIGASLKAAKAFMMPAPEDIAIVMYKEIINHPAYPHDASTAKCIHKGIKGVLFPNNQLAYVEAHIKENKNAQLKELHVTSKGLVLNNITPLYRTIALADDVVQPLFPLPGKWINQTTFAIDKGVKGAIYILIKGYDLVYNKELLFYGPENVSF